MAPGSKRSNSSLIHWRGTDAPRPVDQKPSAGWSRILLLLEGSQPTMSMAKVYETVFSASVVLAVFYPFFVYWRTYVAFRLLGTRVEQLGLAWFSFEFQLPNLRSNARLCGLFRRSSCRLQEPSYRDSKSNQRRANPAVLIMAIGYQIAVDSEPGFRVQPSGRSRKLANRRLVEEGARACSFDCACLFG